VPLFAMRTRRVKMRFFIEAGEGILAGFVFRSEGEPGFQRVA
jgi:hypothetical protein